METGMYLNPTIQTATIIGASLGGLATAIALRKVGIEAAELFFGAINQNLSGF